MAALNKKRKAVVNQKECVACGCCVKVCPRAAIAISKRMFARIDEGLCVGCGKCQAACPASVIGLEVEEA